MDVVDHAQNHSQSDEQSTLRSHLEEIAYQFREVRHRLDPRPLISAHPIAAVAGAFALGAIIGMRAGRSRDGESSSRGVGGIVWSIATAVALRAVREVAMQQLARVVREQFRDSHGAPDERPTASA